MSAVAPAQPQERAGRQTFTKGRRSRTLRSSVPTESAILFLLSWAAYSAIGWLVVARWHIVVGDAVSRLAHAYFVWFNDPAKLTAVGFVWPPLMTLVFLPAAAVKPLATSLLALPLTSAFFGAGLVVVLDRSLALFEIPRLRRFVLLALLALNPMLVYYAANGMAEMVYLFLLALATYAFVRWYLERNLFSLVLASGALTLGVLTRYELLFWAGAFGVSVLAVLIAGRASRRELEATAIAFFAPIVYGLGLWIFFNWLILRDPFHWLSSEVTLTFVETRAAERQPLSFAPLDVALRTASVTWALFPATAIVLAALLLAAAARRNLVALVLAFALLLSPLTTALLALLTKTDVVFQLRYNLRSLPLALLGLGWLCWLAPVRWRFVSWAIAASLLAASIPTTWHTMQTYERQALEQAFTRAVTTGEDQEGTRSFGSGTRVGNGPERQAADWVVAHTTARRSVLADDEQAFAVMLYSGRPSIFFDRIDDGDVVWNGVLAEPRGRVSFVLVAKHKVDLIRVRYPRILETAPAGWLRVFENARWKIFRIER